MPGNIARAFFFAASAVASTASAQNADFKALMERTNAKVQAPSKAAIEADALTTMQAIAKEEGTCVPTGVEIDAPRPATSDRLAVGGITLGKVKNVWTAYGRTKGCPSALPTRFLILLMSDDKVLARKVNDGESLASPSLMRDSSAQAALIAYQTVRRADASCAGNGMTMLGSKVVSKGDDLGPDFYGSYFAGSWKETWTFRVCGKSVEVPVTFRADGDGGAFFDAKGEEAKLVD